MNHGTARSNYVDHLLRKTSVVLAFLISVFEQPSLSRTTYLVVPVIDFEKKIH